MKRLRGETVGFYIISLLFLLFFVFFQTSSIYGGDAGDLVTAAFLKGVAHPPGYPLYTFLGWLFTHIPFQTVAWRVGLLSSVSAALAIGFLYLTCRKLTRDSFSSILAACTVGFSYLFWLYAIVPEVFAMHALFSIAIFYTSLSVRDEKSAVRTEKLLRLLFFLLGLSLTHHHTILFLFPAYIYLVWPKLKVFLRNYTSLIRLGAVFLLGLIPYLYVVWAASGNPPINWEDPKTINGFFRLISRAIYGTFRSGSWLEQNNADRFSQLRLFFDTILIDFSRLGIVLILFGAILQFKKNKSQFIYTTSAFLLIGPIFIFYSGFPYLLNFYLGTVERFFIAPYMFLAIWLAFGISGFSTFINAVLMKITGKSWGSLSKIIMIILPLSLLLTTYPKIAPLKNDRTAENLALDVLKTVPDNGALLLVEDTILFNTQYVYYTSGGAAAYRGIKLLVPGIMNLPYYFDWVRQHYPDLTFPPIGDIKNYWTEFARVNIDKFPIYSSNSLLISDQYFWSQYGILRKLIRKENPQLISEYISENLHLFADYQKIDSSALSLFTHVMLSDAMRVYTAGRIQVANQLFELGISKEAENFLKEATPLEVIDKAIILDKLVSIYVEEKRCDEANAALTQLDLLLQNREMILGKTISLFKECYKDDERVKALEEEYNQLLEESKSNLKNF